MRFRGLPQEKTKIYTREEFQEVLTKALNLSILGYSSTSFLSGSIEFP